MFSKLEAIVGVFLLVAVAASLEPRLTTALTVNNLYLQLTALDSFFPEDGLSRTHLYTRFYKLLSLDRDSGGVVLGLSHTAETLQEARAARHANERMNIKGTRSDLIRIVLGEKLWK